MNRILCSLLVATLPFGSVLADETKFKNAKVTLVYEHELPNVPGKSPRAVLVEYGPGGGSPSHRHPSSAFIYARVLEGAIRSKVNEAPERTYQAGESWIEQPGDHHQISQNASTTAPAKLLAIFVVDTGDREIVIPDKQSGHQRRISLLSLTRLGRTLHTAADFAKSAPLRAAASEPTGRHLHREGEGSSPTSAMGAVQLRTEIGALGLKVPPRHAPTS